MINFRRWLKKIWPLAPILLRRRACAFATAALLSVTGASAGAQSHAVPPVSGAQDPTCIAAGAGAGSQAGSCVLKTVHRSLEMVTGVQRRLQIILKGTALADGAPSPVVILLPVSEDLDGRIRDGEITADEATRVWNDIANFDGTLYTLPDLATLKTDLGFPRDAILGDDDLRDLCRAHIQRTLGVSPLTAAYLADRMGIEAVPLNGAFEDGGRLRAGEIADPALTADAAGVIGPAVAPFGGTPPPSSPSPGPAAQDLSATRN